jgi:AcrR family transcriptional regulator
MKATTRSSKEERRREIIEAAMEEFAVGGLHGTPADAIAKRVGVSQPYLFQLFGTKKELFIAAVRRNFERTVGTFRSAAAEAGDDAGPAEVLMHMGAAYQRMLQDRSLLLMQMQAYVACSDEEIREVVREEMLRLVGFVQSASGAPKEAIREWLAYGMLMNVVATMSLDQVDADWARIVCPVTGEALTAMAEDAVGKAGRVQAAGKAGRVEAASRAGRVDAAGKAKRTEKQTK